MIKIFNHEEVNIFFTVLIAFIALFMMIGLFFLGIGYAKDNKAIEIGVECYASEGSQCALHNILEEGDYEDQNIETSIVWLENNVFDLSKTDTKKGLYVARYLLSLTINEREEYIRKVQMAYYEQYIQDN